MLWRHLYLVRAGLAAGLVSGLTLLGRVDRDRPDKTAAPVNSEPSSAPVGVTTETVNLIQATKGRRS